MYPIEVQLKVHYMQGTLYQILTSAEHFPSIKEIHNIPGKALDSLQVLAEVRNTLGSPILTLVYSLWK